MISSKNIPWEEIKQAASNQSTCVEFTHGLYKYPASMSPLLVRSIILGSTRPGDVILDPFCGGGTTAVEAIVHGRKVVCADINPLACFVTETKAKPLNWIALKKSIDWIGIVQSVLHNIPFNTDQSKNENNYKNNESNDVYDTLLRMINMAKMINNSAASKFANLILLRVGQLCYDNKKKIPTLATLKKCFNDVAKNALFSMIKFTELVRQNTKSEKVFLRVINTNAMELEKKIKNDLKIKLVLTSPPYPGVHVLYHRWQLHGRKETNMPYEILGIENNKSESYFTLGNRSNAAKVKYYNTLMDIYSNLNKVICEDTLIVQVLGFKKPDEGISIFRKLMNDSGYIEIIPTDEPSKIISRNIPNRRWYAEINPKSHSQEFIFFHRKVGFNERIPS